MRTTTILLAVSLALAFGAAPALGASASVEGKCEDGGGNGGGGSVGADDGGNVDAVDAAEVESIANGLALFAQGSAEDAQNGNLGDDACHADDDPNDDGVEDNEDGLWGGVSTSEADAGACYDNEGFHTTADCDDGSGGDLPSGTLALP